MQRRIVLTGGGSGGHVYPLIAVAAAIKKIGSQSGKNIALYYMGPSDHWSDAIKAQGIATRSVMGPKMRRYASLANILDFFKFFGALMQALWKLYWIMPDAIFSKGGPGALPVVLAGWFYRIPIMIHESDAAPGVTNLISAWCAKRIAVSFEPALNYFNRKKAGLTGTPVREELLQRRVDQPRAKEELGFEAGEPLLLVLGGSLGSTRLNEFVLTGLKDLLGVAQVLHQTGPANFAEVKKLSQTALIDVPVAAELKSRYQPIAYFEGNYAAALSAADLVLSRAGSSTISEIAAFGKPTILVPLLESANDHQRQNAYAFSEAGAALVIEEANLLPGIVAGQIAALLKNPELLAKMGAASQAFYRPNAAEVIGEEVVRIGRL